MKNSIHLFSTAPDTHLNNFRPSTNMTTKICKTPVGKYKGNQGDHVVQFLGIKYASLKDRLSAPEMILRYDREIIDATLHG